MAVVNDLINVEAGGSICFGNYELENKAKRSDFQYNDNTYKIKTCKDITKLERNEMFVYESVPGTSVMKFVTAEDGISFAVEGVKDTQITVELNADTEYEIFMDEVFAGKQKTNLGGKLTFSIDLSESKCVQVLIKEK